MREKGKGFRYLLQQKTSFRGHSLITRVYIMLTPEGMTSLRDHLLEEEPGWREKGMHCAQVLKKRGTNQISVLYRMGSPAPGRDIVKLMAQRQREYPSPS